MIVTLLKDFEKPSGRIVSKGSVMQVASSFGKELISQGIATIDYIEPSPAVEVETAEAKHIGKTNRKKSTKK